MAHASEGHRVGRADRLRRVTGFLRTVSSLGEPRGGQASRRGWVRPLLVSSVLLAVLGVGCGMEPTVGSRPPSVTTVPPVTGTSSTVPTTTRPSVPPPTSPSATTTFPTTSSLPLGSTILSRGPTARRVVALTFDAGSDAGNTARILDLLAASGIRATFGITGVWAEANPDLLRRIVRDGHQVVNHSFDHRSFTGVSTGTPALDRGQRVDELTRADAAVRAVTSRGTGGWFRPPYGDRDSSVDADVGSAGYRYELMWTVDSLGWKGLPAFEVAARCLSSAVPRGDLPVPRRIGFDGRRSTGLDHLRPSGLRLRLRHRRAVGCVTVGH